MGEILLNGLTTIVSGCFIAYYAHWLRKRDKNRRQ
ncbi:type I toxin-antitoxin system Fst family toxin [Staphylococcus intermedius]|nr:type I toxin-antitoxin system Fst family toxin [Staphylococcus intermedius]